MLSESTCFGAIAVQGHQKRLFWFSKRRFQSFYTLKIQNERLNGANSDPRQKGLYTLKTSGFRTKTQKTGS